jgi:tight adherence protein C
VSAALLLAVAAALSAAAAITDLLTAPPRRPRPPAPASAQAIGHLAGMMLLVARIARRAGRRAAPHDLQARIAAAGAPLGLTAGDVVALKGAGAVGALLCAFTLLGLLPGRLGLVALLAAPAAGYVAPERVLARRARRRERRIAHEIADVLDLLRVAVGGGLPVGRAIGEVGRRMHGVLAAELAAASVRLQLGAPRGEVFAELVARCPGPGVATLTAAIARSERHGAPLAGTLTALATEARAEQARRVRDDAARAAPKIQLVVALVLVPAVMLLIGAVLVQGLAGSR